MSKAMTKDQKISNISKTAYNRLMRKMSRQRNHPELIDNQKDFSKHMTEDLIDDIFYDLCRAFGIKDAEIMNGLSDKIYIDDEQYPEAAVSVDRHILKQDKRVCLIECKTRLGKREIQTTVADFKAIKAVEPEATTMCVFLEWDITEGLFRYYNDMTFVDAWFGISGKREHDGMACCRWKNVKQEVIDTLVYVIYEIIK